MGFSFRALVATYKNLDVPDSHFLQKYPQKCHFGVNHKTILADFD